MTEDDLIRRMREHWRRDIQQELYKHRTTPGSGLATWNEHGLISGGSSGLPAGALLRMVRLDGNQSIPATTPTFLRFDTYTPSVGEVNFGTWATVAGGGGFYAFKPAVLGIYLVSVNLSWGGATGSGTREISIVRTDADLDLEISAAVVSDTSSDSAGDVYQSLSVMIEHTDANAYFAVQAAHTHTGSIPVRTGAGDNPHDFSICYIRGLGL